uniref:Ubiquitin-like domain-containing protein n=1 Tax=Chromera velia CCMP2878 TaxID=1169474 RepID=A0A0G4HG43_9ALVE|eukprot:Cvel_27268.t1-p1 / transcript=Cvel_27268.t1 / gene=Cvel_27268 / organism=Chromera_velia_CCMP2878 / gene_product=hypothetical protein / transcript_product=hypothetical protein / location=Cvel_scaffold3376:14832-16269(+) / protein_length=247 / sequence_SO=supercontig / SO=protein_coding / is_pseudo=false
METASDLAGRCRDALEEFRHLEEISAAAEGPSHPAYDPRSLRDIEIEAVDVNLKVGTEIVDVLDRPSRNKAMAVAADWLHLCQKREIEEGRPVSVPAELPIGLQYEDLGLQLFVKGLHENAVTLLRIAPLQKVAQVYEIAVEKTGLRIADIVLTFGGHMLRTSISLLGGGLKDLCTVHLSLADALPGGHQSETSHGSVPPGLGQQPVQPPPPSPPSPAQPSSSSSSASASSFSSSLSSGVSESKEME